MSPAPSPSQPLPCGRPKPPAHAIPNEAQFAEWQSLLKTYLVKQSLKYTEQRWKIAQLILTAGGHLDAQGIVDIVKARHPGIGAATVYRNLKVLCDASILKESLTDAHGRVVYELNDEGHHDHIICTDCGQIFEFHDDRIEDQQNQITQRLDFSAVRHRHVIYARCEFEKGPSRSKR